MNEDAFARAALPAATRILGFALRPYSIGHELILIRSGNAMIKQGERFDDLVKCLPEAVAVCSRDWHGYLNRGRERFVSFKFMRLSAALRAYHLPDEILRFIRYYVDGSCGFRTQPRQSHDGSLGRYLGTPNLLLLHQFALSLPTAEWQAYGASPWDYPYALAQMRHAAVHELAGDLEVENNIEREAREAAEEWEREHPGSTLNLMKD